MKKIFPIVIIFIGFFCFFYFRLYHIFTFQSLRLHRDLLLQWTKLHYGESVLIYLFLFIVCEAASVPAATFLTLVGGFLFGTWGGAFYAAIAATIGGSMLFLMMRMSLAEWFLKKSGKWLRKMEKGFRNNAFNYLLTLRLLPFFPFWGVNIVAGLLGIRLKTFLAATIIGIMPGTFIYASVGHSLSSVFDYTETPTVSLFILKPEILMPLIALALLSLLPVFIKGYARFKK